jgi:hypothetical protein
MSDADWDSLCLQLGRYALQRSRRFYWRTGRSGELPDGEVTGSLVSKAIVLWLTGRRRWNRLEYTELREFLEGIIDSLLSHSATGYDNRGIPAEEAPLHVVRTTPESELLARERGSHAAALLAEIVRQAHDDIVVIEIIEALRDGVTTRRDLVKVTGRSAPAIDNALKRLRRLGANVSRSQTHEYRKAQ